MATIREHVRFSPDDDLGQINKDGEIFGYLEATGEKEYIGRVDYDEGIVFLFDEDTEIALGWVDERNRVIASFEEEDIHIGDVKSNGDLYYYIDDNDSQYVGKVEEMTDPVEGAAALLIFFEFEEDDDNED